MFVRIEAVVTVQATGQTWRAEMCEHCKRPFYYPVTVIATGSASSSRFFDPATFDRAEAEAQSQLDRSLTHAVVPATCPHCTLYQAYMVPAVKAELFPLMRTVGILLLVLTPVLFVLGFGFTNEVKRQTGRDPHDVLALVLLIGAPALSACAGIGLLIARLRRQTQFDPNAAEYTETRRLSRYLALKPEEFAKLNISPPSLSSPHRRGGQLVNQNCVRCGERISNEFDSQFCHGCGSPVHNRCAVSAEGGCAVCGAPIT